MNILAPVRPLIDGIAVKASVRPLGIGGLHRAVLPLPASIADVVRSVRGIRPADYGRVEVTINGQLLTAPREHWHHIWPKRAVEVQVFLAPGAKDGGAKQILTLVAVVALTLATAGAASAGWLEIGGLFAKGSYSAAMLASGIGLVGSLALSALSRPATTPSASASTDKGGEPAAASANALSPGGRIPCVIGQHKVFPPAVMAPLIYVDGDNEVVEVVYALAGPHQWSDIRVEETPIDQMARVTYETREGWDDDAPLSVTIRYGITDAPGVELRGHTVQTDAGATLDLSNGLAAALPTPARVISAVDPDEIWLSLQFLEGLADVAAAPIAALGRPVRIRMRPVGDPNWRMLPELHFTARRTVPLRKQIKLIWSVVAPSVSPPSADGVYIAYNSVPTQGVVGSGERTTGGWTAHASFDGGPIYTCLNTALYQWGAELFLNHNDFPRGFAWEIEVSTGHLYSQASFSASAYSYGGSIYDFFGYYTSTVPVVSVDQSNKQGKLTLARIASVYNAPPITRTGFALIALRGSGVSIGSVSAVAGRYVQDWDPVARDWSAWTVTSNPAPHMRDLLAGQQTFADARLAAAAVDDGSLLAWRAWCGSAGHEVNAIVDDGTMDSIRRILESCGRARLSVGVNAAYITTDRDRSAEPVAWICTPLNSSDGSMSKPFADRPQAFRASYRDRDRDYAVRQITVVDPDLPDNADIVTTEAVDYLGLVTEAQVRDRATFDFRQSRRRAAIHTRKVDWRHIAVGRGALVGLVDDALADRVGYGRIKSINRPGGLILSIDISADITVPDGGSIYGVGNIYAVADLYGQGTVLVVSVQLATGAIVSYALAGASGSTLTFATPFAPPAGFAIDNLVAVTPTGAIRRMIVTEVNPSTDETATIVMVAEAPDLFR